MRHEVYIWEPAQAGFAAEPIGLVREPSGSECASSARSASGSEGAASAARAYPIWRT